MQKESEISTRRGLQTEDHLCTVASDLHYQMA